MHPKWPVEIVTDEAVACGAVLVRHRGRRGLTIVVKASFSLVHGGAMLPGAPVPVAREDRTFEGSPGRSLEVASDLAPFLPRCDVLLRGHVYAQKGQAAPAGAARLALFRDARPLLDKTIHVFAQSGAGRDVRHALPRAVQASAAGGADQLFSRMPIVYERAFGGPDVEANPAGTKTPNLVNPADPRRPAGFGPIAPHWAARRRLFGTRRPDPESLPDDLEWGYFQAAPPDQQIDHLRGGEWLVLDGLHPVLARLQTQVPAARGAARVLSRDPRAPGGAGGAGPGEAIELVADTLFIDGDAHQCTVTWRGRVPITGSVESLAGMAVLAGLELPDRPVAWGRLAAQVVSLARPARPVIEEAPRSIKHQTMTLSVEQHGAVAVSAPTPFSGPASVRSPARDWQSQPRTDATPWGPPSVRSMPVAGPAPLNATVATPIPMPPDRVPAVPFVPGSAPEPPVPLSALPFVPGSVPEPPVPLSALPFVPGSAPEPPVSLSPLPFVPGSVPGPPETPPWAREDSAPAISLEPPAPPPEPSAAPLAVEPPPLVGPIQAAFTPSASGSATTAAQSPDAAPKPEVPPPLPRSLGKGNLGADQVASFLKAFELPPGGGKG